MTPNDKEQFLLSPPTPGAARDAIFALERGVCQLCRLDTHALLQALTSEPSVPERMKMLEAVGTFGVVVSSCIRLTHGLKGVWFQLVKRLN